MTQYIGLLRGINVGGKNKVSMEQLRACLEKLGYTQVRTYIASGNVLFSSAKSRSDIIGEIEAVLPRTFTLDSSLIKVALLTVPELKKIIQNAPAGFGTQPERYHSDAIFLMGISAREAMTAFKPRDGVDKVWLGDGVIYSQRLSAERTKSRLSAITLSPLYKSMTIRSWSTTVKLLELAEERAANKT